MDLGTAKQRIGLRVKELRESLGLSQAAFAKRVGVTQRAVSGVERGLYLPSVETLLKIAEAFDADPGVLLAVREKRAPGRQKAIEALGVYLRTRSADDVRRLHRVAQAFFDDRGGAA